MIGIPIKGEIWTQACEDRGREGRYLQGLGSLLKTVCTTESWRGQKHPPLGPWFHTSGLQDHERSRFCGSKPPSLLLCQGALRNHCSLEWRVDGLLGHVCVCWEITQNLGPARQPLLSLCIQTSWLFPVCGVPGVTYPRPRSRPRPPDDGSTSLPALFHLVPLRSHLCRVATLCLVRAAHRSGVLATSWVHRWIPGSELCPDSRLPSPSPSHLCSPCYACAAVLPTPRSSASPSAP